MVLSDLGHEVDLMTYPLGEDVSFKNLRIFRVPNLLLFQRSDRPSYAKVPWTRC